MDPYAVLGLDRAASADDVRAAFRRRVQLVHPDLHQARPVAVRQEAERAMTQLGDAYRAILGSRPPARRVGRLVGRLQVAARPAYRLGRALGRHNGSV